MVGEIFHFQLAVQPSDLNLALCLFLAGVLRAANRFDCRLIPEQVFAIETCGRRKRYFFLWPEPFARYFRRELDLLRAVKDKNAGSDCGTGWAVQASRSLRGQQDSRPINEVQALFLFSNDKPSPNKKV